MQEDNKGGVDPVTLPPINMSIIFQLCASPQPPPTSKEQKS